MPLGGTHECYFEKISDYGDQTERSGWLEWRSHGCPKVTGTTSLNEISLSHSKFHLNAFIE
jgi:hypothetical protein